MGFIAVGLKESHTVRSSQIWLLIGAFTNNDAWMLFPEILTLMVCGPSIWSVKVPQWILLCIHD